MSLPDVLQWIMNARKTGRLDLERMSAHRSIYCRDGRVIACSTDDPTMLMGQFLLCHGRISEETLREALGRQEVTGENLGHVLVEMGALREDQLMQVVSFKATETIHGIFDWTDADFEFVPDGEPTAGTIEIDVEIQEILLEGVHRMDQMIEIRQVFPSTDAIPGRTDKAPEEHLVASPLARKIYEAIDGKRSIAEIVLVCHTSDFLVGHFLLELHELEAVTVLGTRQGPSVPGGGEATLDSARQQMDRGDYYAALEILEPMFEEHPNDASVKSMLTDAEARFAVAAYRSGLHPLSVPLRVPDPAETLACGLTPEAAHLLDRIDGKQNVKAILVVLPMRPARALWTLKHLHYRGLITLEPPRAEQQSQEALVL